MFYDILSSSSRGVTYCTQRRVVASELFYLASKSLDRKLYVIIIIIRSIYLHTHVDNIKKKKKWYMYLLVTWTTMMVRSKIIHYNIIIFWLLFWRCDSFRPQTIRFRTVEFYSNTLVCNQYPTFNSRKLQLSINSAVGILFLSFFLQAYRTRLRVYFRVCLLYYWDDEIIILYH